MEWVTLIDVCIVHLYRHKPFQMCKNTDHQLCEDKASIGENRFAHSIEELVVWTIERHFREYITIIMLCISHAVQFVVHL